MVDVTKTRAQLILQAAANLGLNQPGEPLASEDDSTLDNLVDPLIAQLSADRVVYVQDADEIPVEYFLPVARLLAVEAGPAFGNGAVQTLLTNARANNLDALQEREYATLRRIVSQNPTFATQKTQYF